MNKKVNEGIDAFLTDAEDAEDGIGYIKPDLELKLSSKIRKECKQIVQEIKKFGIRGDRQKMYLIYLLALEIEDRDSMLRLTEACKKSRNEIKDGKELILPK